MTARRVITLLGATGSVGCSTLDVIARHPDSYEVFALSAYKNVHLLAEQCRRFKPRYAVISEAADLADFRQALAGVKLRVLQGAAALERIAADPQCDTVVAGIVGVAGLPPTLAAVAAGKRVLLANKEALVSAGRVFMETMRISRAVLLPIDSEHNALFQCLSPTDDGVVQTGCIRKITLTASGGPFLNTPPDQLHDVTPEQACAHPNWSMGRKISVDSATMMNKGLELIEARWLFDVPLERIEILIHPQSIVHAMVHYKDGSVAAQMSCPDMRVSIAYALAWPERIESGAETLELIRCPDLEFQAASSRQFPCLRLACEAAAGADTQVIGLNAANEAAVESFLGGKLKFVSIPEVIEQVLAQLPSQETADLEAVLQADAFAREISRDVLTRYAGKIR